MFIPIELPAPTSIERVVFSRPQTPVYPICCYRAPVRTFCCSKWAAFLIAERILVGMIFEYAQQTRKVWIDSLTGSMWSVVNIGWPTLASKFNCLPTLDLPIPLREKSEKIFYECVDVCLITAIAAVHRHTDAFIQYCIIVSLTQRWALNKHTQSTGWTGVAFCVYATCGSCSRRVIRLCLSDCERRFSSIARIFHSISIPSYMTGRRSFDTSIYSRHSLRFSRANRQKKSPFGISRIAEKLEIRLSDSKRHFCSMHVHVSTLYMYSVASRSLVGLSACVLCCGELTELQ